MTKECPSSLALDAFRLGFDSAPAEHIAGCSHCTGWLAAQEQLEAKVAHLWVPAEPKPRRPARTLWRYARLGLTLAGAAAVLIFLARPRQSTETAKGGPALVQIARLRAGVLSWLSPADDLAPKDAIRIFVNRTEPSDRYVLVGSVDGTQQIARLYPMDAQGCGVALPAAGEAIDGSIVVDDAPGPERLVVLVSHEQLCWPSVGDAMRRFALGDPLPRDLVSKGLHAMRLVLPKRPGSDR
jgi:hypothetical protein